MASQAWRQVLNYQVTASCDSPVPKHWIQLELDGAPATAPIVILIFFRIDAANPPGIMGPGRFEMPFASYAAMIDLLRNEGPLFARDDGVRFFLTSAPESVGDGEG